MRLSLISHRLADSCSWPDWIRLVPGFVDAHLALNRLEGEHRRRQPAYARKPDLAGNPAWVTWRAQGKEYTRPKNSV